MTEMLLNPKNQSVREGTGLIIFNSRREVLIGQSYRKLPPVWHLPQGGIPPDCEPYANAMRVAKRELGLWHQQLWFVGLTPSSTFYTLHGTGALASRRTYNTQQHRWAVFRYLNHDRLPPVALSEDNHYSEPNSFFELRWASVEDALNLCELFKWQAYTLALTEALDLLTS